MLSSRLLPVNESISLRTRNEFYYILMASKDIVIKRQDVLFLCRGYYSTCTQQRIVWCKGYKDIYSSLRGFPLHYFSLFHDVVVNEPIGPCGVFSFFGARSLDDECMSEDSGERGNPSTCLFIWTTCILKSWAQVL